jgi:hypothetical protein
VYPASLEKTFFLEGDGDKEAASALLVLLPLTLGIDRVGLARLLACDVMRCQQATLECMMAGHSARVLCSGRQWPEVHRHVQHLCTYLVSPT